MTRRSFYQTISLLIHFARCQFLAVGPTVGSAAKKKLTILHVGESPCVLLQDLQVTIRWVRPPCLMVYSVNPTSLDPGLLILGQPQKVIICLLLKVQPRQHFNFMWGICGSILPNEPNAPKYASHIDPWFHSLSLTTCDSWRRLRTLQTHTSAGTGAGGEQRLWSQCGKWTNESPGREWGWRQLAPGIPGGLFWKDLGCEVLPQT